MADTVATGAYKYLMTGNGGGPFTAVTALLGSFPPGDPDSANAGLPWLFTSDLLVNIGNSSAAALVLSGYGGWQVPQRLGTERYARLRADMYLDPARDAEFNVTETSSLTKQRGAQLATALFKLLHRRDPDTIAWGDLVTTGCQLIGEAQFEEMPSASGNSMTSVIGTAVYGVSFSGYLDQPELYSWVAAPREGRADCPGARQSARGSAYQVTSKAANRPARRARPRRRTAVLRKAR